MTDRTTIPATPTPVTVGRPMQGQADTPTSILPVLLMISLLIPMLIPVGPILLTPHRVFLLLVSVPLALRLLTGQAGPLVLPDYLMIFSTVWASLALAVSEGTGVAAGSNPIEAIGIHWIEFLGAYLVGRVAVRSAAGFASFVKAYFLLILILLPFAAIEALTFRPLFLDLFPNSISPNAMTARWGMRRAQVAFSHPILFGVFTSTAFGLFWYVLRPNIVRATGVMAAIAATVFSLSSGALISLTMQSMFIAWEFVTQRISWRWRLFLGLFALFYVAIDLLSNRTPFHVLATYAAFNTGSGYARILIWQWGVENVAKNPIFGLGLDVANWERPYWKSSSADNFWLVIAMQFGLPTVIAFATAVLLILRGAARATLSDPLARRCQAGFLTTLGGLVIAGGTVHYWHSIMAFSMFFFGAGVWLYTTQAEGASEPAQPPEPEDSPEADEPAPSETTRYTRFTPQRRTPSPRPTKPRTRDRSTSERAKPPLTRRPGPPKR